MRHGDPSHVAPSVARGPVAHSSCRIRQVVGERFHEDVDAGQAAAGTSVLGDHLLPGAAFTVEAAGAPECFELVDLVADVVLLERLQAEP